MSDESKVKTTLIKPVNRTMSYEDRRGYVYVCICMTTSMSKSRRGLPHYILLPPRFYNLLNNTTLCANWSLPWGVLRS